MHTSIVLPLHDPAVHKLTLSTILLHRMMTQPHFDGILLALLVSLETGEVVRCVDLANLYYLPESYFAISRSTTVVHAEFDGRYLFAQFGHHIGLTILDLESITPVQSPVESVSTSLYSVWGVSLTVSGTQPEEAAPWSSSPATRLSSRTTATPQPAVCQYTLSAISFVVCALLPSFFPSNCFCRYTQTDSLLMRVGYNRRVSVVGGRT